MQNRADCAKIVVWMDRQTSLQRIKERARPWDIVVVGGGATGVGCAVDAASRGLDVLLLEKYDFGKGTSGRSTKLIHGGVRYLERGNISLVREALVERGLLFRNAPHLVEKQAFIVPCYSVWEKFYYGTGLKIYDALAGRYSLGRSQVLSRRATLDRLPGISESGLRGGVLYFDGQFDDTRLLIELAATADRLGACIVNYSMVTGFGLDENGRIAEVRFVDSETSQAYSVNARSVINAAGPFCDEVRGLAGPNTGMLNELSRGTHIVLDRRFLPGGSALMVPKTADGRVLFLIPWHGHLLAGTTDIPINGAIPEPRPSDDEIDFILETLGPYLSAPPSRGDILSVFSGIRPLVRSSGTRNTAKLSRGHTVEVGRSGLVTITGGKWTTYRRMAEDAVDHAVSFAGLSGRASRTKDLIIDATGPARIDDASLRLHPDLPYTRPDIVRAVRGEMARTVEDVLARRTRALFLNARAALEIAPAAAAIMADEMGKPPEWVDGQLEDFREIAKNYMVNSRMGAGSFTECD